jgi:hypothetical protein
MKQQSPKIIRAAKKRGDKKTKGESEEFGAGRADLMLCPTCSAVYYKKSWHHNLGKIKQGQGPRAVHLRNCPACDMWQRGTYEGEVKISGLPKQMVDEVSHNILHFADMVYSSDPLDRVLDINYSGSTLLIRTSENQLAQKLAKHLAQSFKGHLLRPVIREPKSNDDIKINLTWR